MNDYLDYLQHHGIKGQKWGVRRFQNEDGTYTDLGNKRRYANGMTYKEMKRSYNKDRKNFLKEAKTSKEVKAKRDALYRKANSMEAQANNLYKKYNFDGDDGGGGKTAADIKAGRKYMKLYDEAARIRDQADRQGRVFVQNKLFDKYGKESVNQFRKEYADRGLKNVNAALAVIGTLGMAGIAVGTYGMTRK